jgi:hypothetical protein
MNKKSDNTTRRSNVNFGRLVYFRTTYTKFNMPFVLQQEI